MKVGVIGCGGMGTTHYLSMKALSDEMDLEVVALADCRPEFLERAMEKFPNAKGYSSGNELIENEALDIVHICLPSNLHVSHAVAAMEKGMNVFIEKPVCLTEAEGEQLLETEKKTGVKAMVGQVVRSTPEYRYLKKLYDDKTYGTLKSIVMQRVSGRVKWGFDNWFHDENRSGSVVLDLHVHDLDFLRYMLGEPNSFDVKASAYKNGMINQIITSYEFQDTFAVVEGIWDESPALKFRPGFRACFEDATLVFDGLENPSLTIYKTNGEIENPEVESDYAGEGNLAGINISDLGPYYTEIKYFAECVRDGKPSEIAPLSEGVKSVEWAIREWKAAKKYVAQRQ